MICNYNKLGQFGRTVLEKKSEIQTNGQSDGHVDHG